MSVRRWKMAGGDCLGYAWMACAATGENLDEGDEDERDTEFVLAQDYDALAARLKECEAALDVYSNGCSEYFYRHAGSNGESR